MDSWVRLILLAKGGLEGERLRHRPADGQAMGKEGEVWRVPPSWGQIRLGDEVANNQEESRPVSPGGQRERGSPGGREGGGLLRRGCPVARLDVSWLLCPRHDPLHQARMSVPTHSPVLFLPFGEHLRKARRGSLRGIAAWSLRT